MKEQIEAALPHIKFIAGDSDKVSKTDTKLSCNPLSLNVKSQPYKQHIWFFDDTQTKAEKTKRAVF